MKQVLRSLKLVSLALTVAVLAGCAATQTTPYDYSAFEKSKPRSIVVIPPLNNSIEVNAPYIYLSTVSRGLAEKGYYVFPVAVIDRFLKENGLPGPAEMNNIPLEKIDQHIGADAVLYVTIEDWGQKYQVVSSAAVVKAKLRLVDVKTGEQLWDASAQAIHNTDNSGNGIAGMLIGALVSQVVGSIADVTPELSAQANAIAFNSDQKGLLNGPYYVEPDQRK
ncbi:MAG: DUF799 domain-containing protein [Pseudomonadales bacterium]